MLETSGFPDRHTSRINIANRLSEIDEKYCINQKVNTVVHDSAANMLGALNILNDKHNWDSLRCFAHTLQLSLIPELNVATIDRLISAARKLVGHFKHSVLATEELMKREAQVKSPSSGEYPRLSHSVELNLLHAAEIG